MRKTWLYYVALFMPLILRVLVLNTGFVDWLWYHQYTDSYYFFSNLSVNPSFLRFIGSWALPAFIVTVMSFWLMESNLEDEDTITHQFLLLPIMYIPYSIIAEFIETLKFNGMNLFAHPVMIIPFGYIYIGMWIVFIRVMERFKLIL